MPKNQLQVYADTQLELLNPYKEKSIDLKLDAELHDIVDDATLAQASEIRKQITKHKSSTEKERKAITGQFNDVVKQFIAMEKDALKPADEAQAIIQKKMVDYEAVQEEKRQKEAARVKEITDALAEIGATTTDKIETVDARLVLLKNTLEGLPSDDQELPEVAAAYAEARQALLKQKDDRSLGTESDEAAEATAAADKEDAEHALQLAAKAEAEAKPKTGLRTRVKFEIIDADQVPRELCVPSDQLIREVVKQIGATAEIPGVRVYEERGF